MSEILNDPSNVNELYSDKFRLVLRRMPHVVYFGSKINLPGINIQNQKIPTPIHHFNVASTKLTFDPLVVSFRVDEDLKNYREIFNWMEAISPTETTDSHANFIEANATPFGRKDYNIYSDASLIILNNVSNFNVNVIFKNVYPINLTGLEFDLENNTIMNATVQFEFDSYRFE